MIERLVIIDDDPIINEMLSDIAINKLHIRPSSYESAEEFLKEGFQQFNTVYLVDWCLPGIEGPEIVKSIRARDKLSPVFMLSGKYDKDTVMEGLLSGADDFLVKPIEPEQLITKIENARIKTDAIVNNMMNVGFKVFIEAEFLMKDGEKVGLTTREFQLFRILYEGHGEVRSRDDLMAIFNGRTSQRNIDVLIYSLRKKLAKLGLEIETVRGRGYKILPSSLNL